MNASEDEMKNTNWHDGGQHNQSNISMKTEVKKYYWEQLVDKNNTVITDRYSKHHKCAELVEMGKYNTNHSLVKVRTDTERGLLTQLSVRNKRPLWTHDSKYRHNNKQIYLVYIKIESAPENR